MHSSLHMAHKHLPSQTPELTAEKSSGTGRQLKAHSRMERQRLCPALPLKMMKNNVPPCQGCVWIRAEREAEGGALHRNYVNGLVHMASNTSEMSKERIIQSCPLVTFSVWGSKNPLFPFMCSPVLVFKKGINSL